jgi:hypothetical protein
MAEISKINIGGTIYNIKDAEARRLISELTGGVDSLGTASELNYAEAVANDKTLPTGAAIVKYVGEQIADINAFEYEVVTELPEASAETMYKIYLLADAEGQTPDAYEEWITIKTGDAYSFEKIGDTNIGLNGYVPTARKIAGLALSADITAEQLQAALGLGALAYKNTIAATVNAVTGVGDIDYTPAGEVAVQLQSADTEMASAGKFTPAGTVSGKTVANGEIAVGLTQTATAAELTKSDYTPAGSVSVALSGATFNAMTGVGTQATYTEGEFTPATLTKTDAQFAKEGLVASMNEEEETLTLSAAGLASASLISAFDGGSKAKDTFVPNSLPTMAEQTVGVQSATFAGTTAEKLVVSGVSYDKASVGSATFTGKESEIAATFAGTEGDVAVKGNYSKATGATAGFAGTAAKLEHTVTKQDIAVAFDIK